MIDYNRGRYRNAGYCPPVNEQMPATSEELFKIEDLARRTTGRSAICYSHCAVSPGIAELVAALEAG
jgi:hypothetical protein